MSIQEISIIVPSYNPSEKILELVAKLEHAFEGIPMEIIVVNDHSDKKYDPVFQSLAGVSDKVSIISLPTNRGQFSATLEGCQLARYEWIATIDDDLEYDPADMKRMAAFAGEYQLIYGLPPNEQLNVLLGIQRRMYLLLIQILGIKRCSSMRIFHREVFLQCGKYFNRGVTQIDLVLQQSTRDIKWLKINKLAVHTGTRFNYLHLGYFIRSLTDWWRMIFF